MQQLVCAVGAETDLIMCAENRWPTLRLEMQLPMRDLSYPPVQSKSARAVNTALASTGKGVPRNREEAMHLLAKVASLGDDKAQKWIDTNCPGKPDWLKALRQTSLEDDARK